MKIIYKIASITALVLLLSACGGVSGDGKSIESIAITMCDTETELLSEDTIIKDEDGTEVRITHNADDTKTVCVTSGKAHIQR